MSKRKAFHNVLLAAAAFAPLATNAAASWPGQLTSGEAGYTIGCSLSQQMGVPSCGELPSGRGWIPVPTPIYDGSGIESGPGGDRVIFLPPPVDRSGSAVPDTNEPARFAPYGQP